VEAPAGAGYLVDDGISVCANHPESKGRPLMAPMRLADRLRKDIDQFVRLVPDGWTLENAPNNSHEYKSLLLAHLLAALDRTEALEQALLAHRADMHEGSNRPCPTCRQSAKALGLKVPDRCARGEDDKAALALIAPPEKTEAGQ
jgi:hypothetical protein